LLCFVPLLAAAAASKSAAPVLLMLWLRFMPGCCWCCAALPLPGWLSGPGLKGSCASCCSCCSLAIAQASALLEGSPAWYAAAASSLGRVAVHAAAAAAAVEGCSAEDSRGAGIMCALMRWGAVFSAAWGVLAQWTSMRG
jgi:hypothetical protein